MYETLVIDFYVHLRLCELLSPGTYMTSRRDFLKASAIGAGLAFSPSLFSAGLNSKNPRRFIFIRKSSGLISDSFIYRK